MKIIQKELKLKPRSRGFHLITREIEEAIPEIREIDAGMAFIHLKHTSASLTLNENADPDVRRDMESIFNNIVRENQPWYTHTFEGSDDMPAHAKSSIIGPQLSLPVSSGRFNLGTWQGIYLCEHRNHGGARRIVVTVLG
ncbi:MAG: secondary thiamine-phosphate synthase enzyme YjbQ [Spirochaetales bacterium]|uniref:Secondary thiamine-phosphate synthase enzyme YjbQ n=1 Tax=Candidatus Thalassospirochaeta sargassi TaxID=3119039 RepID=A0AAJ1IE74_9SPIO|nr:secondary thiamine-phosphate synthase enzyme YjbQ [Spirochaetales bacterium]